MGTALLILGLFLFIMLVVVHEFGHFMVAKRNGVKPEEFGIFFPPRLWKHKTKNGWLFTINLLPLGGFVRLKGEFDAATSKGSYGAASLGAKTKILLAGVGMNLLAAFIILTALGWLGMPQLVPNQFHIKSDSHTSRNVLYAGNIEQNSPASAAGLRTTDSLLSITTANGTVQVLNAKSNLHDITKKDAGQVVSLEYQRGHHTYTKIVKLRSEQYVNGVNAKPACVNNGNGCIGVLGVIPIPYTLERSTWSAPVNAVGLMVQFTVLTFKGIGLALHGLGSVIAAAVTGNHAAREAGQTQATNQVAGPVGVFKILQGGSSLGYQFVLMVIAIISLSLAIINVLPIPPLDGGKLFLTLAAHARHKRLSERVEGLASGIGFAFFFILFVLITIADVKR